jgi:heme-degrading monooxygenase HmoA
MALLGQAAVAMWWDMSPDQRSEFEDWHSHEHFPERMSIPGFLRGSRWASSEDSQGFFVMYELADYRTLTSNHYLARLNNPTPWSTRMMPHHRHMVRSQCQILESHGGGIARSIMTIRFSPTEGGAETLRRFLAGRLTELPSLRGMTGAHLLQTKTPDAKLTEEQKIRGGDAIADWILVLSGYHAHELLETGKGLLGPQVLIGAGAMPSTSYAMFDLACTLTPSDL